MAGGEGDRAGEPAVRQRDAGVGGRGDGGGDAGHDDEGHARVDQRLGLFAAAAEDERIAALEAHDDLAPPGSLDEERVDLLLLQRRFLVALGACGLTGGPRPAHRARDQLGGRRRVARDDLGGNQAIGDDHVGSSERFDGAHGDEPGIAGAGADEIHKSIHFLGIPSA